MPYHQSEWIWYVAQLVIESRVEGQAEPIRQIETVLLQANSPETAYAKALSRCASSEHSYRNKTGASVTERYLGIHDIENLQAEKMEDAQVLQVQVVPSAAQGHTVRLLRSKNELSLFGGESPEFSHLNQ